MAKLISIPTSPTEAQAPAHLIAEGDIENLASMYESWQHGDFSGSWANQERPRYDAVVLLDDDGVPVCAAS